MKTLIRFSNKQKNPPLNMGKKKIWTLLLLCFKCCRKKTGAVHHMISEIYLLLHLLWTEFPPGAITAWLIRAGVKEGETSDPHTSLNLQHHHGRGKDQPQSSSSHVPFLSPLIKAATNHRQGGGRAVVPCSTDPTDTENSRHGGKARK